MEWNEEYRLLKEVLLGKTEEELREFLATLTYFGDPMPWKLLEVALLMCRDEVRENDSVSDQQWLRFEMTFYAVDSAYNKVCNRTLGSVHPIHWEAQAASSRKSLLSRFKRVLAATRTPADRSLLVLTLSSYKNIEYAIVCRYSRNDGRGDNDPN